MKTLALAAVVLTIASTPALAAETDAEQHGSDLLGALERGDTRCSDLGGRELEAIGEHVMGRMLGSSGAHEAMDRLIASMMGTEDADRMHRVMGTRFAGCGNSRLPLGLGPMMGAMGMMGGGMGPGGIRGGETSAGEEDFGPRGGGLGMMDGYYRGRRDDEDGEWVWMAIAMALLGAIVVAAIALVARPARRRTAGSDAFDLLAQRFAHGEISTEEYDERRRLLEGGSK